MKRLLLLSLLGLQSISAMQEIDPNSVSSAQALKVYTNNKKVFVEDDNATYLIAHDRMNSELRKVIANKALVQFTKNGGYLRINKDSEEKYNLAAKMRLNGGGPVLGWILYSAVKVLAYAGLAGVGVGAVTAVSAATGGAVIPVGATIATAKVATGVVAATTTTSAIGAALVPTTVGAAATAATTASIATSGVAGYVATVEALAMGAFAFGSGLPTP